MRTRTASAVGGIVVTGAVRERCLWMTGRVAGSMAVLVITATSSAGGGCQALHLVSEPSHSQLMGVEALVQVVIRAPSCRQTLTATALRERTLGRGSRRLASGLLPLPLGELGLPRR